VAAMTPDQNLCSHLISRIHNRASLNTSMGVFPVTYDSTQGSTILGVASPAQGAVFAPLALKAPVLEISANGTTVKSSSRTSQRGAVVGAVFGGVVALLAVVGVVAFTWRRRRRNMRQYGEPPLMGEAGSQVGLAPQTMSRHPQSSPLEVVVTASHIQESSGSSVRSPERSSSPSFSSAPIGLSDKELARLRAETLRPQHIHTEGESSAPIGLSDKELARLRAETLRSQHTHTEEGLDESQPESVAVPDVIPERRPTIPPPETPGLRSIVQTLQIEVQRLREERFDAPPSYADDDA